VRWEAAARCKTGRDPLRIERAGRRGGHGPVTARVSARNKRRKCVDVKFEQFEHGADVGVRGFGATPAEAFEGAAQALFALLAERASPRAPAGRGAIGGRSRGPGGLLVAFLNELGRAQRLGAAGDGGNERRISSSWAPMAGAAPDASFWGASLPRWSRPRPAPSSPSARPDGPGGETALFDPNASIAVANGWDLMES